MTAQILYNIYSVRVLTNENLRFIQHLLSKCINHWTLEFIPQLLNMCINNESFAFIPHLLSTLLNDSCAFL